MQIITWMNVEDPKLLHLNDKYFLLPQNSQSTKVKEY